jgi:hypothetical protein
MIVIKNLFFDIKFPFVIPRGCFTTVATPVEISGLEFDLKMVEFEQNLVATYITNHQSQFTSSVISDLNSLMDDDWKQFFVPANLLASVGLPWAKKLLNVSSLDFMEYSHRVAIGKAMVYNFHSKSEAEYLKQISITPRAFTL